MIAKEIALNQSAPSGECGLKAPELALSIGALAALAQGQKPGEPGGAPRGAGGLGQEGPVVSEPAVLRAADMCERMRPLP